jgi:hypothetical protein
VTASFATPLGPDARYVEGVAIRQAGRRDERLIWSELEPLLELKGAPEAARRLRAILAGQRGG